MYNRDVATEQVATWNGKPPRPSRTPARHLFNHTTPGQARRRHMNLPATPLEWQALWDAMDAHPDAWIPTTEHMYWDMLECVFPRAQARDRFLVGEAKTHNEHGHAVHACFWEPRGGQFFARHLTVDQFWQLRHVDAPGVPA